MIIIILVIVVIVVGMFGSFHCNIALISFRVIPGVHWSLGRMVNGPCTGSQVLEQGAPNQNIPGFTRGSGNSWIG